jgi:hypothetical protein
MNCKKTIPTYSLFLIFLFLGVVGSPGSMYGQDSSDFPIELVAGINLANFGGDAETDMRVGFAIGAQTEFELNETLDWEPGILLMLSGARDEFNDNKWRYNQWYLNLPMPVRYGVDENLSLKVGPYLGFLLDSKVKNDDLSIDDNDSYKTIDLGLVLGVAYALQPSLKVGAVYNLGLLNINDVNSDDFTVTNQVFQILITYSLDELLNK